MSARAVVFSWRTAWRITGSALCLTAALCAAAPLTAAAQSSGPDAASASTAQASATPEDIRDIRGPKAVPRAWLLPVLLSAVILLALGFGVWQWRRRANRGRDILPFELALQRLEESRALMAPASARQFGITASEIVRTYIEQRFAVIARQRTTEEFLQDLLQNSNDSLLRHRPLLAEFLQQCDFVKFAGMSLTLRNMESLFDSARSFVLETGQPPTA